jgi:hypothetical protein
MEFRRRQDHEPAGYTLEKEPHPLNRRLSELQTQFGRCVASAGTWTNDNLARSHLT